MGVRVVNWASAHPDNEPGFGVLLAQLQALVVRMAAVITAQRNGVIDSRASRSRKRELRSEMLTVPIAHLAQTGGLAARFHPVVSTIRSMRDVVREYGEHPEMKSLGPDGQTCDRETMGLLARRHAIPSWIQHIRKEANRLEDVERGDVQEWDQVLERFQPRGKGEWGIEVLPTLKLLGAERVAAASCLSPRQVYRILGSGSQPPPRNLRILTRVALAYLANG